MRYLPLPIFFLVFLNTGLFAQSNLKFKKLVMVDYDVKGQGENQSIVITDYREISGGKVHVISKIFKGISDTTYQFPDSIAKTLNSVFGSEKTIRSFLKLDKGLPRHYAGKPFFITCTHWDNTVESVIIEMPYLDDDVYKKFDLLYRLRFGFNVARKGDSITGTHLEATILKYHKACKYLIKVEEPPTQRILDGPPPEKN